MNNIYKIPPRMDTATAMGISSEIEKILENAPFLILDFSDCTYMSSMGIRILVKAKKVLLAKGGELFISNAGSIVMGILEMSGMLSMLKMVKDNEEGIREGEKLCNRGCREICFDCSGVEYKFSGEEGEGKMVQWDGVTLASYDELGVSVGMGIPADTISFEEESFDTFCTIGNCAAFLNSSMPEYNDFRVAAFPSKTGIYLSKALSFNGAPSGIVVCDGGENSSLGCLLSAIKSFKKENFGNCESPFLCIVIENTGTVSVSVLLVNELEEVYRGATFLLGEWRGEKSPKLAYSLLAENLTIDNIVEVKGIDTDLNLRAPVCSLFLCNERVDFRDTRLKIETEGDLELYKEFLARRIYTDSSKIVINQLHGGFSAQTFQVDSFDSSGRKLRPTVMKVAAKSMIDRESAHCIEFALPYIMNNSAQVIGTEFFGEMGALRYNFVGIGGGQSKLKWLTDYYFNSPVETLEPIFDKIFSGILEPWYGQAVPETLTPYLEHDPTLTFFPHIFDTALKVLGIAFQEQYIYVEELGREMLNPYWFLKYEYPKRRNTTMEYFCGVCHGDLNMQNILLDEVMNVYLIDFSETKPRCAVSDFARMEVIMMIDNSPCNSNSDYSDYCKFVLPMYENFSSLDLSDMPDFTFTGNNKEFVEKNLRLVCKMREYALTCANGEKNPIPYYFPFLEWSLPIVCYGGKSLNTQRLSMIISGIICEKIFKL